jgi:hypothetical protein
MSHGAAHDMEQRQMAAKISIDDQCAPQLSDAHRQAIAAAETSPVALTEEAVLAPHGTQPASPITALTTFASACAA